MRLWSLHPRYLDTKGFVALWRETLLAKHVLEGKTKGYKNHPQLDRFRAAASPIAAINHYLTGVLEEAVTRGYSFTRTKVDWDVVYSSPLVTLPVRAGQVRYEAKHLLTKLEVRDPARKLQVEQLTRLDTHPSFFTVSGENPEPWEVIAK